MAKLKKSEAKILRLRAEEYLGKNWSATALHLSEADSLKLIHELEVQQVELEMQYEELIQARAEAHRLAERFAELYEFAPLGYFALSKEGDILESNINGAKMLGKERQHLKDSLFAFFISDDTKPIYNHFLRKVFKSSTKETCEATLAANTKTPVYVLLTGIATGNRERCIVTMIDITEQRQAAMERDRIFEYSTDMLCIAGFDGYFKRISPSFEKTLGWTKSELLSRPLFDFIHPHDVEASRRVASSQEESTDAIRFENLYLCKDGSYKWISWNSYPINEEKLIIGVARDITDRKKAEAQLRFQSDLLANISDVVYATDLQLCVTYFNHAAEIIYGWKEEEALGKSIIEVTGSKLNPDQRDNLTRELLEKGSVRANIEYTSKTGSLIIFDSVTSVLHDVDGKVIGFVGVDRDITERIPAS